MIKAFNGQERKDKHNNNQSNARVIGSLLIALSGILLFLDKILDVIGIEGSNTFGFSNFSNFIWAFMQSIAPILLIIGFLLRPYFLSILIPIYCYSIQTVWVFHNYYYDNIYLQAYAIGACVLFCVLVFFIKWISKKLHKNELETKAFIENANLFMEEVNKTLIRN